MIPRVLLFFLIASAITYFIFWIANQKDRALVAKVVTRVTIAAVVGALVTFLIVNVDRFN